MNNMHLSKAMIKDMEAMGVAYVTLSLCQKLPNLDMQDPDALQKALSAPPQRPNSLDTFTLIGHPDHPDAINARRFLDDIGAQYKGISAEKITLDQLVAILDANGFRPNNVYMLKTEADGDYTKSGRGAFAASLLEAFQEGGMHAAILSNGNILCHFDLEQWLTAFHMLPEDEAERTAMLDDIASDYSDDGTIPPIKSIGEHPDLIQILEHPDNDAAAAWLDANNVDVHLHLGYSPALFTPVFWESILADSLKPGINAINQSHPAWQAAGLDPMLSRIDAAAFLTAHPDAVAGPILYFLSGAIIGFNADAYAKATAGVHQE